MKKQIFLLLCLCMLLFSACHPVSVTEGPNTLYHSDRVKVTLMEPETAPQYVDYEWSELTEERAFGKNTVILTGKVLGVREVSVEYSFLDAAVTDYFTILDVSVSGILHDRAEALSNQKTLTIGIPVSSRSMSEGIPVPQAGKTFLFFCYPCADTKDDPMETAQYVDCWLSGPNALMVEKVGNHYITSSFLSAYVPSARTIRDCLNVTESQAAALMGLDYGKASVSNQVHEILSGGSGSSEVSQIKNPAAVLASLKERSAGSIPEFWNQINTSCFVDGASLEQAIARVAEAYSEEDR